MISDENRLRVAVQKSGRLADPSIDLLKNCGLRFAKSRDRLFCHAENYPLDLLLLRDDDIPEIVNEGACDLGIVGTNVYTEHIYDLKARKHTICCEKLLDLGFGPCRLSLAAPKESSIKSPADLKNKRIATSYPRTLAAFLKKSGIKSTIVTMSGALEVAPRLKIADAIFDLVATGDTLAANGLLETEIIAQSQAILIRSAANLGKAKEELIRRLISRIKGVQRADESKYIMLHCPIEAVERVKKAIPGAESPTILPLQGTKDKVAMHAVCNENVFWETIEQLKAIGASAILVMPIEKMME
ncbi:MAG: ATP phosphoribosyltransferase [Bdellovibrionales bacterium]